jgi:hypothetical protein
VTNRPNTESTATGSLATPPRVRSVAGSSTTTFIAWRPMIVRNRPIPLPTASFTGSGNTRMIYSRAPTAVSRTKITPSTTTAASAVCHGTPRAPTTVNAKKALSPSPGACANGRLAYSAMISVAAAAARMVITASIDTTAGRESPWTAMPGAFSPAARTFGLTTTM